MDLYKLGSKMNLETDIKVKVECEVGEEMLVTEEWDGYYLDAEESLVRLNREPINEAPNHETPTVDRDKNIERNEALDTTELNHETLIETLYGTPKLKVEGESSRSNEKRILTPGEKKLYYTNEWRNRELNEKTGLGKGSIFDRVESINERMGLKSINNTSNKFEDKDTEMSEILIGSSQNLITSIDIGEKSIVQNEKSTPKTSGDLKFGKTGTKKLNEGKRTKKINDGKKTDKMGKNSKASTKNFKSDEKKSDKITKKIIGHETWTKNSKISENRKESGCEETAKKFKCDHCEKAFSEKHHLTDHILTHTKAKDFKCDTCGMLLGRKSSLERHLLIHTGVRKFKCEECGQAFRTKSELGTHMVVHTRQKNFKCDECEASFQQKSSLVKHKLVHAGIRKYKCDSCDQTFGRRGSLIQHLDIHSGVKKYNCDICGKFFRHPSTYHRHMVIHTGVKAHKCNVCDKPFALRSHLTRHIKIHSK